MSDKEKFIPTKLALPLDEIRFSHTGADEQESGLSARQRFEQCGAIGLLFGDNFPITEEDRLVVGYVNAPVFAGDETIMVGYRGLPYGGRKKVEDLTAHINRARALVAEKLSAHKLSIGQAVAIREQDNRIVRGAIQGVDEFLGKIFFKPDDAKAGEETSYLIDEFSDIREEMITL